MTDLHNAAGCGFDSGNVCFDDTRHDTASTKRADPSAIQFPIRKSTRLQIRKYGKTCPIGHSGEREATGPPVTISLRRQRCYGRRNLPQVPAARGRSVNLRRAFWSAKAEKFVRIGPMGEMKNSGRN